MIRRSPRWIALPVLALSFGPGNPAAAAGDQARLDAAIEGFESRMTEAGWVPQDAARDDETDTSGAPDDEADEDDVSIGDEEFAACFGDLADAFGGMDGTEEFPGQIAERTSDEFAWLPDSDVTATTEAFSFDIAEQTVEASAAAVADEQVPMVTRLIEILGDQATGQCMRDAFATAMSEEPESGDIPIDLEIEVTNEADLGIGDHSASLGMTMSMVFFVPIQFNFETAIAQVDNTVVAVSHSITGEAMTEFDPADELRMIVADLDG